MVNQRPVIVDLDKYYQSYLDNVILLFEIHSNYMGAKWVYLRDFHYSRGP